MSALGHPFAISFRRRSVGEFNSLHAEPEAATTGSWRPSERESGPQGSSLSIALFPTGWRRCTSLYGTGLESSAVSLQRQGVEPSSQVSEATLGRMRKQTEAYPIPVGVLVQGNGRCPSGGSQTRLLGCQRT